METTDVNIDYYAERATEYDITSGYQHATSAATMAPIKARYQLAFEGQDVLEIACGTGYWTRTVAVTARSVLATDVNPKVIAIAKQKVEAFSNVRFQVASAYTLEGVTGPFTAAFAQFWWSHVPSAKLREFLDTVHSKLRPGSRVMFLDAMRSRHRLGRRVDESGDVLEARLLRDGRRFEIIKNFPNEEEIQALLADITDDLVFRQYPASGCWIVSYKTV